MIQHGQHTVVHTNMNIVTCDSNYNLGAFGMCMASGCVYSKITTIIDV